MSNHLGGTPVNGNVGQNDSGLLADLHNTQKVEGGHHDTFR